MRSTIPSTIQTTKSTNTLARSHRGRLASHRMQRLPRIGERADESAPDGDVTVGQRLTRNAQRHLTLLRVRRLLRRWCAGWTGRGSRNWLGLFLLLPADTLGHEAHLHLVLDHLDDHRIAGTVLEAEQLLAQRVL